MAPSLPSGASDRVSPTYAPYSPYSNFHLPSSSSDSSDNGMEDDVALPFPAALQRKDFLSPGFEPTAYLSSLFPSEDGTTSAQRHQTLEDLRAELRERSSAISAELLELVNSNYTSFLELGDELRGGDEKVEDVRMALFGFRRAVQDIQGHVRERRVAVSDATIELGHVRSSISIGRKLLELDDRASLLEERLAISNTSTSLGSKSKSNGNSNRNGNGKTAKAANGKPQPDTGADGWGLDGLGDEDDDEEDDDDDDDEDEERGMFYVGSSSAKLATLARDLVLAERLAQSLEGEHIPFVKLADDRLAKCRDTLILDLNAALQGLRKTAAARKKQSSSLPDGGASRLLKILAVYRVLGCEDEAVRILREK